MSKIESWGGGVWLWNVDKKNQQFWLWNGEIQMISEISNGIPPEIRIDGVNKDDEAHGQVKLIQFFDAHEHVWRIYRMKSEWTFIWERKKKQKFGET